MPDAAATSAIDESEILKQLGRVSSLHQIESHDWDPQEWARSGTLLDRLEANLSLARGRLIYEQYLRSGPGGYPAPGADGSPALWFFRRAAQLYRELGEDEGEREALFWVGVGEQVLHRNYPAALEALGRSRKLAQASGDRLVLSAVERHLGFIDFLEGRPSEARRHLEESVRLRRELGFSAGVAMGLVALAELLHEGHQPDRARQLLEEATAIAKESRAKGALQAIEQARGELTR